MLILTENQVRRCLQIEACIAANRKALGSLRRQGSENGAGAIVPTRISLPYKTSVGREARKGNDNTLVSPTPTTTATTPTACHSTNIKSPDDCTLFKPAAYYCSDEDNNNTIGKDVLMGIKIVSVRDKNPSIGKPTVPATVAMLNAKTGEVQAVLGGTYLTAARTAAGSAIATELSWKTHVLEGRLDKLAPLHLVVFGAGLQAELHIRSLKHVLPRNLHMVTIVNRSIERANSLKAQIDAEYDDAPSTTTKQDENDNDSSINLQTTCVLLADSNKVQEAVQSADIIATTTNSSVPMFNGEWVKSGCHINGIGSYTELMEEVDSNFVKDRCTVTIDTIEALNVGDLKHISEESDNFLGLFGDRMHDLESNEKMKNDSRKSKRDKNMDCSFFKSVGTAIQDVFTAHTVVQTAEQLGIGTKVDFDG